VFIHILSHLRLTKTPWWTRLLIPFCRWRNQGVENLHDLVSIKPAKLRGDLKTVFLNWNLWRELKNRKEKFCYIYFLRIHNNWEQESGLEPRSPEGHPSAFPLYHSITCNFAMYLFVVTTVLCNIYNSSPSCWFSISAFGNKHLKSTVELLLL
jgi:hypothetical protein